MEQPCEATQRGVQQLLAPTQKFVWILAHCCAVFVVERTVPVALEAV